MKTKIAISNGFVLKHTNLSMSQCRGIKKQKIKSQSVLVRENISDAMSEILLSALVHKLYSQTAE